MISRRKCPVAALAPFVRYYWYFEIGGDELPVAQMSFPYGSFELICYLENPNLMRWAGTGHDFFEPTIFYAGQLTRPYVMTFDKKCRCVGASLYPWAGSLLYVVPADEFTNQLVPLEHLEHNNTLYTNLMGCAGEDALFDCLETYLLEKLTGRQNDPVVYHLSGFIMDNPGRGALNRQLDDIGLSRRRVEQRFVQSTGLSMGMFARKMRFQKAVHLLGRQRGELNLTAIGLRAGYYDQPHFINEFQAFAGLSPGEFQITGLNNFMKTLMLVG
jgi:AraC-like DNA-binding protein